MVLWHGQAIGSGTHAPGPPANMLAGSDHQVMQFLGGIDHDTSRMLNLLVAGGHGKVQRSIRVEREGWKAVGHEIVVDLLGVLGYERG